MSEEKFIAAITGPAGSGKSTVGFLLKKQMNKCANIDVDDVKHFIGFKHDVTTRGIKKWRFDEWKLLGESIGLVAQKFHEAGYSILITGYLEEDAWLEIEKTIELTHKILILPKLETVISRDSSREEDIVMGSKAIKDHHNYFSDNKYFADFIKIDSTNNTKEQTVEKVKEIIEAR